MTSLFDLKTSASQLPSINQGCSKYQYSQISSTAPVEGANFPNGPKRFRWDVSGTTWWVPSKSYFRVRGEYKFNGVQPTEASNMAINMGVCSNLFQSMSFKQNGKIVCRIEDNVPQVDAVQTRLSKSKSWLDSVGASTNFWQPDFVSRQNALISNPIVDPNDPSTYTEYLLQGFAGSGTDGTTTLEWTVAGAAEFKVAFNNTNAWLVVGDVIKITRTATSNPANGVYLRVTAVAAAGTFTVTSINSGSAQTAQGQARLDSANLGVSTARLLRVNPGHNIQEFCWQPPLSIFNYPGALPACQFELEMNPQTGDLYMKSVIESIVTDITQSAATLNFNIDSMYFYAATVEGPRVDNLTYYLSLDEINVQPTSIDATASIQKKQFDVSPSTYALTIAFQNQGVIQDTRKSASKFKFTGGTSGSTELLLTDLYVQAFGLTLPSPYLDTIYNATTDQLTRMYMDNIIANGSLYDSAGGESKEDWIGRGLYYYLPTPKDGSSESSRVYVNFKFSTALAAGEGNVLLFSHYKKMIAVTVVNGQTTSVLEADQ